MRFLAPLPAKAERAGNAKAVYRQLLRKYNATLYARKAVYARKMRHCGD
jgi:hypothetical protein